MLAFRKEEVGWTAVDTDPAPSNMRLAKSKSYHLRCESFPERPPRSPR